MILLNNSDKNENVATDNENIREIIVERRSGFNFSEVIIIMIIAIMFGFLLGNIVNFTLLNNRSNNDNEVEELVSTYNNIVDNYYKDVDKEKLIDAGIEGMINYLDDPYATYFKGSASDSFNQDLAGNYEGIGIEVTARNNSFTISKVFDNSPASLVGIHVNDVIVKVNDIDITTNKALSDVVSMISNTEGKVKITVKRNEDYHDFLVNKEEVDIPVVSSDIFNINSKKIGYIRIELFSLKSFNQFKKCLSSLEDKNIQGLVIDVRDNPGGYLSQVKEILYLFLDKKDVLYQLDTKGKKEKIYGKSKKINRNYPISVIINNESASASEILASAIKESYGGSVVGVNSYGKGTVQSASDLKSGDTIKYTVQKWLTPKGNWVNEIGVVPDVRVENVLKDGEILTKENDTMLNSALDLVSKEIK